MKSFVFFLYNNPTSYIKLMIHIYYYVQHASDDSFMRLELSFIQFFVLLRKKNEKITMFIRKTDKNFSYRLPSWRRSCWNLNNILLHRVHHSHLHNNSRNLFCLLCCIINKISKKQLKSNNFLEQNQRE